MTAYLPSVLSRTYVNLYFFKINWFLYFVIIFLSLYLWDLIMIDSIISISHYVERNRLRKEKAIQDLKEAWFKCDMLLFLLSILICCLFKINLKGDWNNYKIPIFFIIITSMTGISFLQLSMWGSEIIKSSICDQT